MKRAARGRRRPARTKAEPATYAFCVLERQDPPALAQAPPSLPGCGPLRALDAGGGLWLMVADAPLARYGDAPLERGLKDLEWVSVRALAHERVVEHCLSLGTVLPMKLFTLFRSDQRALEHVRARRRALRGLLQRVRGRLEWGLRLTVDQQAATRAVRRQTSAAGRGASRGTAYLMKKTRERTAARDLLREARSHAERIFESLGSLAAEVRRRPPAGPGLVLDAAFLVDEKGSQRFRQAAQRLQRRLAGEGLRVALTGPWPAYNFLGAPT